MSEDPFEIYLVEPSVSVIKVHYPVCVDEEVRNKKTTFLITKEQAEAMFDCIRTSISGSTLKWCSSCQPDKDGPSH